MDLQLPGVGLHLQDQLSVMQLSPLRYHPLLLSGSLGAGGGGAFGAGGAGGPALNAPDPDKAVFFLENGYREREGQARPGRGNSKAPAGNHPKSRLHPPQALVLSLCCLRTMSVRGSASAAARPRKVTAQLKVNIW